MKLLAEHAVKGQDCVPDQRQHCDGLLAGLRGRLAGGLGEEILRKRQFFKRLDLVVSEFELGADAVHHAIDFDDPAVVRENLPLEDAPIMQRDYIRCRHWRMKSHD